MSLTDQQRAIVAAAMEAGIDPAWALSVAERESSFNPRARSSKTIRGAFQMSGPLRQQYGVGDSDDLGVQTRGWAKFFRQNKHEMAKTLGRDPTDEEGYLGHHFGGTRAARMLRMDPNTPVDQVFTPNELALNPHLVRAGTVGAVNSSILADMKGRHQKYAGQMPDFSGGGATPDAPDFSQFGTLADAQPVSGTEGTSRVSPSPKPGSAAGRGLPSPAGGGGLDTIANLQQPPTGADPNMAIEERKFSAPEPAEPAQPTIEQKMPEPRPAKPSRSKDLDFSQFGTPLA